MTLTQNALVLHTTHQPAKPVETINTSHVFAAETIKTKLLNKNSPLNVEAAKNKANVKTKFIWFWSSKTTCLSIFKWSVNWVAKYLTHRNLLNFLTFKVDKPHGELKGCAPAQSVRI